MDIGKIPRVKNKKRRDSCERNLLLFLETYFPETFHLAWSQDQRDIINTTQTILLDGGNEAFAIYRAGGKTSICERAAIWATLYGHHDFLPVIGPTVTAAELMLEEIQLELETNDLLYEDFPEAIHPIRKLEGEARRCARQTYKGNRTRIEWGAGGITFADIPGAKCAGTHIRTASLEGRLRGMKHRGKRPSAALLDDIQTDESAASPTQTAKRLRIVFRTVLKMAGPKKRLSCMVPGTIIFPNDGMDQLTNRELHPEFNGERRKLVHKFPTNKAWWEEYGNVRAEGLRAGDNGAAAEKLYLANQKVADEGAVIAWPEYTKGKASAVQYVMDEFIDDPDGASAELNNEPRHTALITDLRQLTEDDLRAKLNTLPMGVVPRDCNRLTAFIDVQQEVLFWMVCAWNDKFGGAIIEYGCFPEQPVPIFEAGRVPRPLSKSYPTLEFKARLFAAIKMVIGTISNRSYKQQDAVGSLTISQGLIDAGKWTDEVHEALSLSPFKALWKASKGRSIGENEKAMNDYTREPGDIVKWNCRIDARTTAKGRFVSFDTRPWKTRICGALLAPPGSAGAIYLPGSEIRDHPLLTTHLLSEYRVGTIGERSGRRIEKWHVRPDNKENHLWDCLIGCAVAANINGLQYSAATAAGEAPQSGPAPKRIGFAERQRLKREARAK